MSIATKVLVVDLYAVQRAVPARNQNHNQKQKKPSKQKTHNHNQTKTNKTQRSGIATSNGNNMHDDILCVIMRVDRTRSKTKKTQNHTKGPGRRVIEATKLNAETRDPPQPGSPRSQRAAVKA